jgi:hypothetical protein
MSSFLAIPPLTNVPHWRHKKRGTVYEILTSDAVLQCATQPEIEDTFEQHKWTVYRNIHSGAIYVRLTVEFMDGRFERVDD